MHGAASEGIWDGCVRRGARVGGGAHRLAPLRPLLDGVEVVEEAEGDPHEHAPDEEERDLEAEGGGDARRLLRAAGRAVGVVRRPAYGQHTRAAKQVGEFGSQGEA